MRYSLYILFIFLCGGAMYGQEPLPAGSAAHDAVADNMLAYQRTAGGWPKHIGNEKIDYTKPLSPAERAALIDDASMNDATIDNDATSKEIRYLVGAYKRTMNTDYLRGVEKGIRYLLEMQYKNGGFPQFYPDKSLYRSEITYNDNAMVNALNVLDDVALGVNGLDVVAPALKAPSADAVRRGIDCILKTQLKRGGTLTAWCAQYDCRTLQPAKARSYELPSISGGESAGIIEFLMRVPNPSPEIRNAVTSAVAWFEKVKIEGYAFVFIQDPSQPNGTDRVLRAAAGSTIWARFYDMDTDEPFFCGRDGIRKRSVAEIEHERRVGYAWYGEWPKKLLEKDYPAWVGVQGGSGSEGTGSGGAGSRRGRSGGGLADQRMRPGITLEGEDEDSTRLTFALAWDAWRCDHADDWGVATLNLRGSDITLENLTIENSYGFYDCKKKGNAYAWYADNLDKAVDCPGPGGINAAWVFKGKWDPVGTMGTLVGVVDAGSAGSWSARIAETIMDSGKDSAEGRSEKWNYDQGVVLKGIEGLWYNTGDGRYFSYIQHCMDRFIDKDGRILTYKLEDHNLDNILCGRILLLLYKVTNQEKYYKAATLLRGQLRDQPRTHEGSFWHKQRYPWQVWLDGLYMAQPFYAEYAALFHEDSTFDDIEKQFRSIEQHARDPRTGLLYHGWDESRQEKWADRATGDSPNFWGRAMGWYGMALVDVLDYFPVHHPGREALLAILRRYAAAVQKVQEPATGLWWDILDKPGKPGNYPEASASSMFVYTLAKGVRMGYLPASSLDAAKKGYAGILKKFVTIAADGNGIAANGNAADGGGKAVAANGKLVLGGTVGVSGLGGDPYRDGSYGYYTSEKVVVNDPKGTGAFLLASNEMEILPDLALGKGRTAMLDYYFNNEHKKDITGATVRFHYTWEDQANSGFSIFGHIFRQYGLHTDSLPGAPLPEKLQHASIYIIVDPDDERESPSPNYANPEDINSICDWVRRGGVLILMSNDSNNCEFPHFNRLAERFGIHFNWDCRNKVIGNQYEMGAFTMSPQDGIFNTANKIYIKEISTIRVTTPAKAHFSDGGDVIMAVAKVGKGTVFAVGDPWFYNEYTDGRKLPMEYGNYKAAKDLVRWCIGQMPK